MKKKIVVSIIMLKCLFVFSQSTLLQFSLDPKVLVVGPINEKRDFGTLNYQLKITKGNNKHEIGGYLERFKAIKYTGLGVLYNYKINLGRPSLPREATKTQAVVGVDTGYIFRNISSRTASLTAALNIEIRYWMNHRVGFSISSNLRVRGDLVTLYNEKTPYVVSGFIGVIYKL